MTTCTNSATFAALPRTERGRSLILGGDPKGKTFLYTNGHSVIIRDIANPAVADIYTEHATVVNVAKYSPSGFYIASGDSAGHVRIWDTTNKEHILKNEFPIFAGPIRDLSWSSDSQRLVVGGEGRERFGHVFAADTGTSVGEISGPSKPLNSVDFKPSRPFRIITASEDGGVTNFQGPPFKFEKTCLDHAQHFVNCARYDPNGNVFASCGSDGRIFVYDGKTSDKKTELVDGSGKAHDGGIYSVSWTADGRHLLSASGDKTCKLWDVEAGTVLTKFTLGHDVQDMQLGCLCQGAYLISVSLSGFVNYLDKNNPDKPTRILQGHVKPITALCACGSSLYSGASDASVVRWESKTGEHERAGGLYNTNGHQNQIVRLFSQQQQSSSSMTNGAASTDSGNNNSTTTSVISVGMDDAVRCVQGAQYAADRTFNTGMTPTSGAAIPGTDLCIVTNAANELLVFNLAASNNKQPVSRTKLPYTACAVAVRPKPEGVATNALLFAVGGEDNKVHIYMLPSAAVSANSLDGLADGKNELISFELTGKVTDVEFSPSGRYLAVADTNRKINLYKLTDDGDKPSVERALPKSVEWGAHTARVNSIAWSPDSKRLASGSLDTNLCVWNIDKPTEKIVVKNAHRMAAINGVVWADAKTVVTAGHDANIKLWSLS